MAQAPGGQGYRVNMRHPDARGLVLALPLAGRGYSLTNGILRDATPRQLLLNITTLGTGSPGAAGRHGWGAKELSSALFTTQQTIPAWQEGISWMIQYNQDVTGGFPREIFEVGGLIFMIEIARNVSFYNVAGTLLAASTTLITLGQEYSLGIRYVRATGVVSFFINGAREDVTGVAAQTPSATTWQYGSGGGFRNSGTFNLLRDVRVYNVPLPDQAFERYYSDPLSLYRSGPLFTQKAPLFQGGRMIPFLHPSLMS